MHDEMTIDLEVRWHLESSQTWLQEQIWEGRGGHRVDFDQETRPKSDVEDGGARIRCDAEAELCDEVSLCPVF